MYSSKINKIPSLSIVFPFVLSFVLYSHMIVGTGKLSVLHGTFSTKSPTTPSKKLVIGWNCGAAENYTKLLILKTIIIIILWNKILSQT